MKMWLTAVLLVGTFSLTEKADAACSAADISGDYTSYIETVGPETRTSFAVSADGTLTGEYEMRNLGIGAFTDLVLDQNTLQGIWNDKYGMGRISFKFSDDCRVFDGFWNEHYRWHGTKD